MLLFDSNYLQSIRVALENTTKVDVAVAFWGAGADKIFANKKAKIRIVCNLQSGGTNPEPIALLRARANVEVRQCSVLHAKLLLTDRDMIIGSANFSTNGLHYEFDELRAWKELGVTTQDKVAINAARSWFEELWTQSYSVGDADIKRAASAWKRARRYRAIQRNPATFNVLPNRSEMVDRPIYLAIWGAHASLKGKQEFKRLKREQGPRKDSGDLDFYEDWPELPIDALLIDVHLGPRQKVTIGGMYKRVPSLDKSFTRKDNKAGSIQIVALADAACELPFSFNAAFRNSLRKRLKSASMRHVLEIDTFPRLSDLLE